MFNIVKRSGKVELFNIEKLKESLAASSDEAGTPLTAGDLDGIAAELTRILSGITDISSRDLYVVVVGILYTRGLLDTLKRYVVYKTNYWATT